MATPETTPNGAEKLSFIQRIIEIIKKYLGKKADEIHTLPEAEEAYKEYKRQEVIAERKRQEAIKKQQEEEREYHKRESQEKRIKEEQIERARQRMHDEESENIKRQLDQVIEQPAPAAEEVTTGYETSAYLFSPYRDNPAFRPYITELKNLIEQSPQIAQVIEELTKKNTPIHSDPAGLLRAGKVLYINTPAAQRSAIRPLIDSIQSRVTYLVDEVKAREYQIEMARRDRRIDEASAKRDVLQGISDEINAYLTTEQKNMLQDPDQYTQAIEQFLTTEERVEADIPPIDEGSMESGFLPESAVKSIDNVWREVNQAQKAGVNLSPDQLENYGRELYAAESSSYPTDVYPGTGEYRKEVNAIHNYSEKRLDQLAEMLRSSLQKEAPKVKTGVTDPNEFLELWAEHPGYLGQFLGQNPAMKKLLSGNGEDSYRFRNQVFLRIHASILTQRRESAGENFGLYERSDFSTFTNLIRRGLSDIKLPETGKTVGQAMVEWYVNLSTTIRLSRDIDFWASQPAASIENFNKSLAMFQNEYTVQAMSIPAVEQAYRAYETALTTIRDANDGYLPPGLVEYDPINKTNYWDDAAQNNLTKMISLGVVFDAKRDFKRMGGLPVVSDDGVSFELADKPLSKEDLKKDPENLEQMMHMTLAKGFGMASMRYLEIMANSKVPGVEGAEGMPGFHSSVFEGITQAINYWNVFMKKWKHYGYKYFFMMNAVLPTDKRLPVGESIGKVDPHGAEKAYRAWIDGTFVQKYGREAKAMIDAMNFSRTHSALGPTTPWRQLDSTISWTDKQRELMGGSGRILLAHKLADEKVKEYLVVGKYKEKFRQMMKGNNRPSVGADFEALWQSEGSEIYGGDIENDWKDYKHHHKKEYEQWIENFRRVYKSRMWVEMAMRNPLAIAHNVNIDLPIVGYEGAGKTKRRKLHNYIVEQVLGIPPEDLDTGVVVDGEGIYKVNAAKYSSPTPKQRQNLAEVMDLDSDLIAVREIAIRENRELRREDFYKVIGQKNTWDEIAKELKPRVEHALKYWEIVRKFTLGSDEINAYKEIYKDLGLAYRVDPTTKREMEYYDINWGKIRNADEEIFKPLKKTVQLKGLDEKVLAKAFDKEFLEGDWSWVFSTDDAAFRKMAFLNLGSRQWVRRGGDVAAHYAGGLQVAEYIDTGLLPNPEIPKLAEQLLKIRKGYQGDDATVGWRIAGQLIHLTSKLYEFDYKKLGSYAQLEMWKTRRNVAAWNANKRREFFDTIEHMDVIPPHAEFDFAWDWRQFKGDELMNIDHLRDINHAGNTDVWIEILTLGMLIAIALTIWRGLSTKDEEEEGGGGHR